MRLINSKVHTLQTILPLCTGHLEKWHHHECLITFNMQCFICLADTSHKQHRLKASMLWNLRKNGKLFYRHRTTFIFKAAGTTIRRYLNATQKLMLQVLLPLCP